MAAGYSTYFLQMFVFVRTKNRCVFLLLLLFMCLTWDGGISVLILLEGPKNIPCFTVMTNSS